MKSSLKSADFKVTAAVDASNDVLISELTEYLSIDILDMVSQFVAVWFVPVLASEWVFPTLPVVARQNFSILFPN